MTDYRAASVRAGNLVILLRDRGRLREALDVLTEQAGYTRRARLGPWTQLANQAARLQILSLMGEHDQVLAQTRQLRKRLTRLPASPAADEIVNPWDVHGLILDTGHTSAQATEQWQLCLDFNAEILASALERRAGEYEVTRLRFNDAGPLIRLRRLAEADQLLRECQQVFQEHDDIPALAMVLSTRAGLEYTLAHRDAATELERSALRLRYAHPDPRNVAIGHFNLASYLGTGDRAGRRAHRLAAALLFRLSDMTHNLDGAVRMLAAELRDDTADAGLPATVAEVIEVTGQVEGVRLGAQLDALEPGARVVEQALTNILRDAANDGWRRR